MNKYTEAIQRDDVVILCDGIPMGVGEILAALNAATPPAAAALADDADEIEAVAACLEDDARILRDEGVHDDIAYNMDEAAALILKQAAALRARAVPDRDSIDYARGFSDGVMFRAVPEGKKYHDVAQRLYSILDDIDTAGDIAKSDDKLYRGIVERTQAKKRDYVVSCDGYVVTLADDSMLAASKAGEGKV